MNEKRKAGGLSAAGIILRMAITLLAFVFLGDLIDRTLRTPPWFLVAGIIVAVFVIIADLMRRAKGKRWGKR